MAHHAVGAGSYRGTTARSKEILAKVGGSLQSSYGEPKKSGEGVRSVALVLATPSVERAESHHCGFSHPLTSPAPSICFPLLISPLRAARPMPHVSVMDRLELAKLPAKGSGPKKSGKPSTPGVLSRLGSKPGASAKPGGVSRKPGILDRLG